MEQLKNKYFHLVSDDYWSDASLFKNKTLNNFEHFFIQFEQLCIRLQGLPPTNESLQLEFAAYSNIYMLSVHLNNLTKVPHQKNHPTHLNKFLRRLNPSLQCDCVSYHQDCIINSVYFFYNFHKSTAEWLTLRNYMSHFVLMHDLFNIQCHGLGCFQASVPTSQSFSYLFDDSSEEVSHKFTMLPLLKISLFGCHGDLKRVVNTATDLSPSSPVITYRLLQAFIIIINFIQNNNYNGALNVIKDVESIDNDLNHLLNHFKAQIFFHMERLEDSLTLICKFLETGSECKPKEIYKSSLLLLAQILFKLEKPQNAIQRLKEKISEFGVCSMSLLLLSQIYDSLLLHDAKLECLELLVKFSQSIQSERNSQLQSKESFLLDIGSLLIMLVNNKDPTLIQATFLYAQNCYKHKKYSEAYKAYNNLHELIQNSKNDVCEQPLSDLINLPNLEEIFNQIIQSFIRYNEPQAALEFCNKRLAILRIDYAPLHDRSYDTLNLTQSGIKRLHSDSLDTVSTNENIKIQQSQFHIFCLKAEALICMKQYDNMLETIEQLLQNLVSSAGLSDRESEPPKKKNPFRKRKV